MNTQHRFRALNVLWPLALMILICGRLDAATDDTSAISAADFARHVSALKKKLSGEEFTIVVTPPFVVIGDDPPDEVRRRAKENVQWTVKKLKEAYFTKDPPDILNIWLFKDEESYQQHAKAFFHTKPDTPYGFYSHADRALVMNIDTFATTCSSKGCCGSSTAASTPSGKKTLPGTRRCRKSSSAKTWGNFRRSGRLSY